MRTPWRLLFVAAGLALLFAGLWLLLAPVGAPRPLNAALSGAIAYLILRMTLDGLPSGEFLPLAALSAFLFLASPLVYVNVAWGAAPSGLINALAATLFCGAWRSIEHWSVLMRSVILAVLYGATLWFGGAPALWIPAALLVWILIARRPAAAVASVATILGLGAALYAGAWGLAHWAAPVHSTGRFTQALEEGWLSWSAQWPGSGPFAGPLGARSPYRQAAFGLWIFSVPMALLFLTLSALQFWPALRRRRADAAAFEAILAWTALGGWGLNALLGGPFRGGDLLACLALTAPLIFRAVEPRDFLMSRSVRWILAESLALGWAFSWIPRRLEPAGWQGPLAGIAAGLLAILCALAVSWRLPVIKRMESRLRWIAVLIGSYGGVCLSWYCAFLKF